MAIALGGKRAQAAPNMPRGFDNPDSALFIPEALRPHWFDASDKTKSRDVLSAARDLAWREVNRDARKKLGVDGELPSLFDMTDKQRVHIQNVLNQAALEASAGMELHLGRDFERLMQEARHAVIMEEALRLELRATDRRQKTEARTRAYTCPICGGSDPRVHGGVTTRALETNDGVRVLTQLRSCALCFEESREQLRALRATEVVAGGKTRAELVRKHVAEVINRGA